MNRASPLDAYAKWAATFDSSDSAIVALETRVLLPRMPETAHKRVIDIGCGTGRWLAWAVERGGIAAGIDRSSEMLGVARRKPWACGRVALADAMQSPFRDGCADVVISTLVLGHLRPVGGAIGELARIAAPGGVVIVTDFHPEALRRGWKRTFRHGAATIEIESDPYELSELRHPSLKLEEFFETGFDEPERAIFEAAGKRVMFEQVRGQTAIFVARFRREG